MSIHELTELRLSCPPLRRKDWSWNQAAEDSAKLETARTYSNPHFPSEIERLEKWAKWRTEQAKTHAREARELAKLAREARQALNDALRIKGGVK